MIVKVCQFKSRQQGERLVEVFQPGEMEKAASFFSMGKTASPLLPSVRDLLENIRPDPRRIYILVNALGAGEYWGSNINGDYFPESALIHRGPDYGYETFRTAGLFKHHVNKDASRSFGNILLSAWHDHMKRVELVIEVDRDKAALFGATDVCDKLDQGMFPDVSMGCKVPYDLCSNCTDWRRYEAAKATFDPSRHKSISAAVLEIHKRDPIRGISITRNDYCFPPGTPILMGDCQYRSIEDVAVGDEVIDHTGQVAQVTELLPSWANDDILIIDSYGLGTTRVTKNHPFLAARLPSAVAGGKRGQLDTIEPDWLPADQLREGDTVFSPIPPILDGAVEEPELGWLLGLYIAEGHPTFSTGVDHPKAVVFSFHAEENFENRIKAASLLIDPNASFSEKPYSGTDGKFVRVNSRLVAEWLLRLGGHGSKTKCLHTCVWNKGVLFVRHVILGWTQGDGHFDAERSVLRVATSSDQLARQMQVLSAACGILASLKLYSRETNFAHQDIWYVSFNGDAMEAVIDLRTQSEPAKQCKMFLWKNYLCTSVRKIDSEEYDGPLYNFEVKGTHSYVADGHAVHNCEHLRKALNKIMSNGVKNYAINDFPRFFDISVVFIGADKTAKVMAKLASMTSFSHVAGDAIPSWQVAEVMGYAEEPMEKAASVGTLLPRIKSASEIKAGEIIKDVVPSQFGGKAVPAKDDLPNDILDTLGKGDLSEALSTPTIMGMLIRPREFQRITIISMGNKPLADDLDEKGIVFPHSHEEEPMEMGSGHFSDVIKNMLMPFMEGRSSLEPVAKRRAIRITIMGGPKEDGALQKVSHHPFMQKIAAAYNGYLCAATKCMQDIPAKIASDSSLWGAVHSQGIGSSFYKVAEPVLAHVVGAALAGEVLSNLAARDRRGKEIQGMQAGMVQELIAEHPHALATLAALGALHAEGSSLPKDLLAKLTMLGKKVLSR
jgi:hypothetical protein